MAIEKKNACLLSGLPLTRPAARVGLSPKGEAKPGLRHDVRGIFWMRIKAQVRVLRHKLETLMGFRCGLMVLLLSAGPALAVHTSHWTQTTEADFKAGTFHNTVATNLGDVELSRDVQMLLRQNPKVSAVYALAEMPDGTIYAATGPQGVLLQYKDGKTTEAATLGDSANLLSLLVDRSGRLLIGTGGDHGRILAIDKAGDKPHEIFSAKGVQYVWAICQGANGNLYAATGPNGQLFEITPDGKQKVLLDSPENNLLSLIFDGKKTLYAGTDPNGLVYRVNLDTGKAFVLYDAPESEISALAMDSKGNLYAATAEAVGQTIRGMPTTASTEQVGRPEGTGGGVEIPSKPPKMPEPPKVPNPNPGQPPPIPKEEGRLNKAASPGGSSADRQLRPAAFINAYVFAAADNDDPGDEQPTAGPTSGPEDAIANAPVQLRPEEPNDANSPHPPAQGNAIYRIDPEGFVTEIFRQNVMLMALLEQNGTLLAGTGVDGLIYQINPKTQETIVVAKVDPKQVMSLLAAKNGRIYLGMANVGGLGSMSSGYAAEGTYTSAVLDATQTSRFGMMQMHGTLPKETTLAVATRSGNTREPSDTGWSDWSQDIPAAELMRIQSPAARYLQYRIRFATKDPTQTSKVEDVDAAYLIPNLGPEVQAIKVAGAGSAASGGAWPRPSPNRTISWDASDPNDDALVYTLWYRPSSGGQWLLLKDKLRAANYAWDTRAVADGRYEVKISASDAEANSPGDGKSASRVSDPVVVDNTPPVIGNIEWKASGDAIELNFKVVDQTSTVAAAAYNVDSGDHWQAVFPSDSIFDGPAEAVSVHLGGLGAGSHQITIKAVDACGNQTFATVIVKK
jgi:hypothetical protein